MLRVRVVLLGFVRSLRELINSVTVTVEPGVALCLESAIHEMVKTAPAVSFSIVPTMFSEVETAGGPVTAAV